MLARAFKDAVVILATASQEVTVDTTLDPITRYAAIRLLIHAIRHLAYPDRDVYPKSRKGTKTNPVRGHLGH